MGWSTNENLRKIIAVNNYLRREEHTWIGWFSRASVTFEYQSVYVPWHRVWVHPCVNTHIQSHTNPCAYYIQMSEYEDQKKISNEGRGK
jgi:hypothetical protein